MLGTLKEAGVAAQGTEGELELNDAQVRENVLVLDPDLRPAFMADAAKGIFV